MQLQVSSMRRGGEALRQNWGRTITSNLANFCDACRKCASAVLVLVWQMKKMDNGLGLVVPITRHMRATQRFGRDARLGNPLECGQAKI